LCNQYFAAAKWKEINPNDLSRAYLVLDIWDIATGSIIFTQNIQTADQLALINTMKWAPDHRRLAILIEVDDKYYSLEIWDILTKQKVHSFILTSAALHLAPQIIEIVWSPDGKSIAIGPDVYDVETGHTVITYHIIKQGIEDVISWLPDEKQVLVNSYHYWGHGSGFNTLFVLEASNGRVKAKYDDLGGGLISPNGAYLLEVNEPLGTVEVWRIGQR
jgi:WD40 repeat protein